jgi:N-acetylglutamate synthase-like GNAT family acetyltransferase
MDFALRPARAGDYAAIRNLIHQVRINPTGLDWRRFVVAVDDAGQMLGCGQLKPHAGGIVEMASIAVEPGYRQRGIARALMEHLMSRAPRPLYLTCRSSLGPFYEKWGFRRLTTAEMPRYYRRLSRVAAALSGLFMRGEGLLVMRLQ